MKAATNYLYPHDILLDQDAMEVYIYLIPNLTATSISFFCTRKILMLFFCLSRDSVEQILSAEVLDLFLIVFFF